MVGVDVPAIGRPADCGVRGCRGDATEFSAQGKGNPGAGPIP